MWWLHFLGLDSASGPAYLAWSGVLSDLGEVTLLGGLIAIYRRHNCHTAWCWRFGHHDFTDQETGISYKLCRRHHPHHFGRQLRAVHIGVIHERNQRGGGDVRED